MSASSERPRPISVLPIAKVEAPPSRAVDTFLKYLVAEDARYFDHHGFDAWMIRRALAADLQAGELSRGASTITQQVARNLYLSGERSL